MVDETKVQDTPPEPIVEPQPTVGVDTGVEPEPKVVKTFTEEEHQAEVDRVAGKVRDEERQKYERERERVAGEISGQRQPTQQPSIFRQQAERVADEVVKEARERAEKTGEVIDEPALRATILANATLLERTIPTAVDAHVRVSNASRGKVGDILNRLGQKDEYIKKYRAEIENQVISSMPLQMINEASVEGIADYVIGSKLRSGDLSVNIPKPIPPQVVEVPLSATSLKSKKSVLTSEQKKELDTWNENHPNVQLTEEEYLGKVEIKSTGGRKTK